MNELLDFLKEHLWLFFWIAISIFSAIGEAKKKKREAELGGDAPDWTPPEGDVIPPPELELETVQPQTEAVIPFESFERKLRAYEKATEKRPELLSVNRLLREEVRLEQMRRWEAEGRPSALHLAHPLKRWLEEQLSSVEFIISSRVRGRAEDLKLVEAVAREALAPFETFVRAQGVDYRRRSSWRFASAPPAPALSRCVGRTDPSRGEGTRGGFCARTPSTSRTSSPR